MGMSRRRNSQAAEAIIALGDEGYSGAITSMLSAIGDLASLIDIWNNKIARLFELPEGEEESEVVTGERLEYLDLVDESKEKIEKINKLHSDITRFSTTASQHTIGFVLHTKPIAVSDRHHKFTCDWALVELYEEKIDWDSFKGNKVYIDTFSIAGYSIIPRFVVFIPAGGNLSPSDYRKIMFPRPKDQVGYKYPRDGLLQAYGVVKDKGIRSPQQLDANDYKCLHVVKNDLNTGTTVGCVNGLDSFTRAYTECGTDEVAVLPCDGKRGGGIVGMLSGGGGATEETDTTYVTRY